MENNPIIPSAFEGDEKERIEEHLLHLSHHAKKHDWLPKNEADITLNEIEDASLLNPERAKVVRDFFEHYDKKSVGYLKLIEIQGDPIVFKTIKIVREAREKIAKALEAMKKTSTDTSSTAYPTIKESEPSSGS